ncbi:signal-induced proliferation-associated 1-like protein 2 [Sycon ciliatum]|uniref:signal-induced proliferation-associated 1-like protein 2 n=1 Tax=Sycon ciliatum TaxID=27933 RepID=UPI0020AA0977|eukprot:scpid25498/ scgid19832/ Signal-induced proliferation-associated 1-like protein 2
MSSVVQSSGSSSGPQSIEDSNDKRGDYPVADHLSESAGDKGGWKFLRDKKTIVTSLEKDAPPPSIPSLAVQVKRLAVLEVKIAARLRRKSFAHHDCVSVLSNLADSTGVSKKSFSVNVKSGASAISDTADDQGDGKSNSLVLSTPQFRNEVGDELRRIGIGELEAAGSGGRLVFSPASCVGVLMEDYDTSKMDDDERRRYRYCQLGMWRPQGGHQNKDRHFKRFNHVDLGVLYFRRFFAEHTHQNYFGIDEGLGPVAVSIRREIIQRTRSQEDIASVVSLSVPPNVAVSTGSGSTQRILYRVIVRTSHPNVLRGSVSEDSILASYGKPKSSQPIPAKDIISFVAPEVQLGCLRLGQSYGKVNEQLMKLDESSLSQQFKFGVMYCKADQSSEEEMYNNDEASPAFDEFMSCISDKVELKGFLKYRAQLDNRTDSTGSHSYYTYFEGNEIMFHVSPLLPSTPSNRQQLLRKRHIGNDIVTIIFQEKGALPFTPATIRSHFQHIFAVVRCLDPCSVSGKPRYQVAISQAQDIPVYGPALPENGIFDHGADFREFLLTKLINSELAAHDCTKFLNMSQRTRFEYLNDLAENYVTPQTVDTGDSGGLYGKLARMRKRPDKSSTSGSQPTMISSSDLTDLPGALMWSVQVVDWGVGEELDYVECLLCVSLKYLCLVDEELQTVRLCIPTDLVIGWSVQQLHIRIYYGQGAYLVLNLCNVDEQGEECMSEIHQRLAAVAPNGCESAKVHLERSPGGHLGFMIHRGGIVGQVDVNGVAYAAGIRQGARIVEMDGIPIYGRLHYYVVGHLKKAKFIDAILIAPLPDGSPRGGKSTTQSERQTRQKSMILRKGRAPQRSASSRAPARRPGDTDKHRRIRASIVAANDQDSEEFRQVAERAKLALSTSSAASSKVRTEGRYCESDV